MLRRLAIALVILIALPVAFVPCWIATHLDDLPAVDDADLTVERSEIAPGSNGLDSFEDAAAALDWPEGADERLNAIREGASAEPKWVRQMLARNERAMELLRRGITAPAFALPPAQVPALDCSCCETMIAIQRLLKLAGADARLRSAAGERDEAIERALLGFRAGHRISSGEGIDLLGMMFATADVAIGSDDLTAAVRAAPLTREDALELIAGLESTRWTSADWGRMWAVEYEHVRRSLETVSAPSDEIEEMQFSIWRLVPDAYSWQPRRTRAATAEHYRDRQRRSAMSCREAYASAARYDGSLLAKAKLVLSPNPMGNIILAISTPNFYRFDMKRCHAETKVSLVQALIAVKTYERERGTLPEQLDDLVPRYFERVPEDRFAGVPLRYSRERKAIWSIGDDFTDASGGSEHDPHDATEPALSLDF